MAAMTRLTEDGSGCAPAKLTSSLSLSGNIILDCIAFVA